MVLKSAYRPEIKFDEEIERVRVPPLQSCFQSGKKALNSPIEREPERAIDPLDKFFWNINKQQQPIRNPQPKQTVQRSRAPSKAPMRISPEKARRIAEYRDRESKITLPARKRRIKLLETQNLLKELIRVSTTSIR